MSLANGDYVEVREHVVAALNADAGEGGLREEDDPAVKLIESELRNEPRAYLDHETPSIAVTILGKDERLSGGGSVRTYRVGLFVYCRGLDSELEVERAMKIAARIEKVLRAENAPDRQFLGLGTVVPDALGAVNVQPRRVEFLRGDEARRGSAKYAVIAAIEFEIEVPCAVA